jgi:ADP-ribose pyrophosphatase
MTGFLSKTAVFVTDWFTLVEKRLADSPSSAPYFALETSDYVTVVAVTQNDELVLVRQYRPAVEERTLELPSGHVDPGETPVAAATRELMEETGYVADKIEEIGVIRPDTGRLSNRLWCFFATVRPSADVWCKEADLEVLAVPCPTILRSIATGKPMLTHAHCLAAIGLAVMQQRLHTKAHQFAQ